MRRAGSLARSCLAPHKGYQLLPASEAGGREPPPLQASTLLWLLRASRHNVCVMYVLNLVFYIHLLTRRSSCNIAVHSLKRLCCAGSTCQPLPVVLTLPTCPRTTLRVLRRGTARYTSGVPLSSGAPGLFHALGSLRARLRAKHNVPQRRADAISHAVIGVVMVHVPRSQPAAQVAAAGNTERRVGGWVGRGGGGGGGYQEKQDGR